MCDTTAIMSNEKALEEIPTIEQRAFLGECSDIAEKSILKYIHKLPMSRATMNYEVLSNDNSCVNTFVHNVIYDYKEWLKNDWAKSSDANGAIYNQVMEYIRNGKEE